MPRNAATLLGTCFLLAGCGLSSGGPPEEAQKKELKAKELKAMSGRWRPVSAENNGFKVTEDYLKGESRVLDADGKWSMRQGDKIVVEWKAKSLDPTKTPKAIDIEVASGEHKGVAYLGIYELDGDTLRICFAMPDRPVRPTEFSAGKGSVRALSEFRREKK